MMSKNFWGDLAESILLVWCLSTYYAQSIAGETCLLLYKGGPLQVAAVCLDLVAMYWHFTKALFSRVCWFSSRIPRYGGTRSLEVEGETVFGGRAFLCPFHLHKIYAYSISSKPNCDVRWTWGGALVGLEAPVQFIIHLARFEHSTEECWNKYAARGKQTKATCVPISIALSKQHSSVDYQPGLSKWLSQYVTMATIHRAVEDNDIQLAAKTLAVVTLA